jgi:hypothetical protein
MSAAYHIHASVVEGEDEGDYKKVHWRFEDALADFVRLVPLSEDVEMRYSS